MLADYKPVKLIANTRNQQWYTQDQNWADVDKDQVRKYMRWAFENKDEAKEMGKKARKFVVNNFEITVVGKMMSDRLLEIQSKL
jgi:hypothetical protein